MVTPVSGSGGRLEMQATFLWCWVLVVTTGCDIEGERVHF